MLSWAQIFKSRTVWTLGLAALLNGWNSISGQVSDPHIVNVVNGVLALAALLFRISPVQGVSKP